MNLLENAGVQEVLKHRPDEVPNFDPEADVLSVSRRNGDALGFISAKRSDAPDGRKFLKINHFIMRKDLPNLGHRAMTMLKEFECKCLEEGVPDVLAGIPHGQEFKREVKMLRWWGFRRFQDDETCSWWHCRCRED